MSDQFVQLVTRGANADTTTTVVTITGVTLHNALVAFLFDGSSSVPATHTVADGQGSYTAQGPTLQDGTNNVFGQAYVLQNANAGSHTVTGTVDSGAACWIAVVEIGSIAAGFSGANSALQAAPGAGANILDSGVITVTGNATLVGFAVDTSSVTPSDEPTAGTSPIVFTSRENNATTVMGAYRIFTAAAGANADVTAGSVTGAHRFMTFGVAILNGAVATQANIAWIRA